MDPFGVHVLSRIERSNVDTGAFGMQHDRRGSGGSTAVPKAGGKEGTGQGGGRPGVTRTRCRKDEGASARGCTLGRRNRPIDSRIYLEGGMIQPGRLPRSLPPLTRDARDLREYLREDLPLFRDRSPLLPSYLEH